MEPHVTIRKFRAEPFTPINLIENRTVSSEFCAFIWLALELECSFLIAGNTGSGKTSTLNCLFAFVQEHERIVIVEETPEIVLPHRHFVKMNVVKEQNFSMPELISETLRMRPDRVVVGEIRNREETLAFKDTLLAGQGRGGYATFHAQCPKEAVSRLKYFGMNELDISAIDLLLVQRRWADNSSGKNTEKRRLVEASELAFNGKELKINPLFRFDFSRDCLKKTWGSEKIFAKARDYLGLDRRGFAHEIDKRQIFLEGLLGKQISLKGFFEKINRRGEKNAGTKQASFCRQA